MIMTVDCELAFLAAFRETGDVAALAALADYREENGLPGAEDARKAYLAIAQRKDRWIYHSTDRHSKYVPAGTVFQSPEREFGIEIEIVPHPWGEWQPFGPTRRRFAGGTHRIFMLDGSVQTHDSVGWFCELEEEVEGPICHYCGCTQFDGWSCQNCGGN